MQNIEKLLQYVGKSYEQFDEHGKALGCMLPLYLSRPEEEGKLRFDWVAEGQDMREYMTALFDKHCEQIPLDQLKAGDFVTINMPLGIYHCALYLGRGELLHCTQSRGMETVKYLLYEKRIERGYRWNG